MYENNMLNPTKASSKLNKITANEGVFKTLTCEVCQTAELT